CARHSPGGVIHLFDYW
nr:immunoglobulin heavy chain junction region [Macaca mulatta]